MGAPKSPGYLLEDHTNGSCGWVGLGLVCICAWLSASADSASLTGGVLTVAGLLMVWQPVCSRISKPCWIFAAIWFFGSLAAFLPSSLIPMPAWREILEAGGIDSGRRITPQPWAALGSMAEMTAIGAVALWAAHQQACRRTFFAMAFAVAVGIYALLAWQAPEILNFKSNAHGTFGFFPNRNHTATLLVMGGVVSLGLLAQGIRRRKLWQTGSGAVILLFLLWVLFSLSISRAGVVLIGSGGVFWLVLAGKRYRGGNAGKAVALAMGGGLLIFFLLETPVRLRIEQTVGSLGSDLTQPGTNPIRSRLENLDSRVAIYRDTTAMIADAPWSGWGLGQFSAVFPQYQNESAGLAGRHCLHPESDWLWMAAESGIPATLALSSLALAVILPVVVSIRHGRSRAVRAGLLVAALILPLHGLIDVPGHRFSLLWTSALLLALASGDRGQSRSPRAAAAGWRLAGVTIAGFGLALLGGIITGRPLLAGDRAELLLRESLELYHQDRQAGTVGSAVVGDLLEVGLGKLAEASTLTPLDARIRGLEGVLALHYDDKDEQARGAFAIQRLLKPAWVELPLIQADNWLKIDAGETGALWKLAMERAKDRDLKVPAANSSHHVLGQIRQRAHSSPELMEHAQEAASREPLPPVGAD